MSSLSRVSRSAAVLAVLAITLAGCGGDGDEKSGDESSSSNSDGASASGADPATGPTLETDDFSYNAPDGWEDAASAMPGAESVAADTSDDDGFADNLNVLRLDPAPVTDLDELEDASVDELEGADASDVKVQDRAEIDGVEAIHISGGMSLNDNDYLVEQYNVIRDDVSFIVTFSFSPDVSEGDRTDLSQSVLASWAWAS